MHIYCSGIGGIGLSAYAALQREAGHAVSGSDRTMTPLLEDLQSQGIAIHLSQDGSALSDDIDLFVYSEAIPLSAPERIRAAELGIPQASYPEALGKMSEGFTVIAVCGTHGKSSTTGMVARLLMETGRDPTVVVGTKMPELGGRNWRRGESTLFVLEACEYRKSFHFYKPTIILMTNCDGDHFDYYKSIELYREAFRDFLKLLPSSGVVITHASDPDCQAVTSGIDRAVIDADEYPLIDLQTPGLHMKQNAQLVLALANELGIVQEEAIAAVAPFAGTWRRMETKGAYKESVTVIDDYAHHPREIRATVSAIRGKYPNRRLVAVYQPHTHNRTLAMMNEFAESFAGVDRLIVTDVYDARSDTESEAVDLDAFVRLIAEGSDVSCVRGGSLDKTEALARETLQPNDVLLCMGAGDITELATRMTRNEE